jgi:hypothetical protein
MQKKKKKKKIGKGREEIRKKSDVEAEQNPIMIANDLTQMPTRAHNCKLTLMVTVIII